VTNYQKPLYLFSLLAKSSFLMYLNKMHQELVLDNRSKLLLFGAITKSKRTKIKSVLRSPHVNKNAQEHFAHFFFSRFYESKQYLTEKYLSSLAKNLRIFKSKYPELSLRLNGKKKIVFKTIF
jgi:ribosomal protein S10